MKFNKFKTLLAAAGCGAAMMAAAIPSAASADITWVVTGTFDDGTPLVGSFTVGAGGYVSGSPYLLTTQPDALNGFVGETYENPPPPPVAPNGPPPSNKVVQFFPNSDPYLTELQLTFANSLQVASANDPIVGASSYECQGSFGCLYPTGGVTRYLVSGFASAGAVPEPATWAMMLIGFGGLGLALRTARRRALPAMARV
jgi:hypothetical protein